MQKILIVEDQFIEAQSLQILLQKANYHVCSIARSVASALDIIAAEKPDLVLIDIYLKGNLTGIDLAWQLQKKNIGFIYLSANSNQETLDQAKVTKPYGFLVKPYREKDLLIMLDIAKYQHEQFLLTQKQKASTAPDLNNKDIKAFGKIIGVSPLLTSVLEAVTLVAPFETSVLILGESGTGKELIAESIHNLSPRKNKPYIKVNCAALPASLIESELFGHEKGSFTGAYETRKGKFEQANGGTIFLDEVGEMPIQTQVKLLRVLQEKEIERVGGKGTIKIDTRFIAATNRNLEKEVAEDRFRMDLYYRLNVFPVTLPPLRQRKEDIPLLVQHFMAHFSRKNGTQVNAISTDALQALQKHEWPGNVRELENLIERSVLLARGPVIKNVVIPEMNGFSTNRHAGVAALKSIEENEKDHIIAALKRCNGKVSGDGGAAQLLNINVSTLNSRIKKLGIKKNSGSLSDDNL